MFILTTMLYSRSPEEYIHLITESVHILTSVSPFLSAHTLITNNILSVSMILSFFPHLMRSYSIFFHISLISLRPVASRFIHVVTHHRLSSFLMAEYCSIVYVWRQPYCFYPFIHQQTVCLYVYWLL